MTEERYENRLNRDNIKFYTLCPVWDNEKGIGLNVFEMIDELNRLNDMLLSKQDCVDCEYCGNVSFDVYCEKKRWWKDNGKCDDFKLLEVE